MGKLDPKSTGGEGFDFEDKVGAYFLSFLLVGADLFPTLRLGRLRTVQFQRKVDGWEFDDVILGFDSSGVKKQIAFSVKSNSQLTANKIPSDLVKNLWEQFCKTNNNPFRLSHDFLGLITSGTSTAAIETYRSLQKFALRHKGHDLAIHLQQPNFTNQHVRDLYESFEKPAEIQCRQNFQRAEIIERLLHFDINLDDPSSPFIREAYSNLSVALVSGEPNDLWIKLQHMTKTSRTVSGEINFSSLISELKDSFEIKGQRHLGADQEKIKTLYEVEIEKIKSTIGNCYTVDRSVDFAKQFKKEQINAFIGESGVGKSVLLKQWVRKTGKPIIWIPYAIFKARTLPEINSLLGIQNDLFDILKYGPTEQIVIIDAIDRLTGLDERDLLKSFLIRFQRTSDRRHLCVISCQDQIWKTLVGSLSTHEVLFNVINSPLFTNEELNSVARGIPVLSGILKEGPTKEILKNPKYLDLAVQMAEKSSLDTSKEISEPVLIHGFWNLLSDGTSNQKQSLLIKIAVEQADTSNFLSPATAFSAEETRLMDSLSREGILKIQDGWIRFSHDLYGDWIRQRYLLSQRSKTTQEIVQRKNNIYWHQAIRLASLEILEIDGFDNWKRDVISLKASGDDVLVDLFLDIAITSLNQKIILESIKELLFSEDLNVLHRFLERFLAYATAPNPQIMSMREQLGLNELEASQFNRIPLYTYWPSLLQFLSENFSLASGGKVQMSQIAERWLTSTPFDFPFRREAASIAYYASKWIFEFKREPRSYVTDGVDKKYYQALLAAYPELPDEIEDLCLKMIGLRDDGIENPIPIPSELKKSPTLPLTRRKIEKIVFPNGPEFKKDREFQDVCLGGQNFENIVNSNPSLAAKILLAAIIDNPKEWEELYDDGWRSNDRLGTAYTQQFNPPLYSKGPFLNFFRLAPQYAIDALILLIKHVSDQWAEREIKRENEVFGFELELNGEKKFWRGDSQVFLWAMDIAQCPDVISAYLMALEKWFYERIDAKDDITPWIDQIINKSDSLAFIGVLTSVGKYSPKLFLNKLRPLLVQPYIIWWDQQFLLQNQVGFISMISWSGQGQFMIDLALKWFGMEHRKTSVEQWALHLLLNIPDMKDFFVNIRTEWEEKLNEHPDSQLEALCCKFNINNYQISHLQDGTQVWNYVAPPEFLEKHKERFEENDIRLSLLTFPMNVNKLLDATSFTEADFSALAKTVDRINSLRENESDDPVLTNPLDCNLALDGLMLVAEKRKILSFDHTVLARAKERINDALENLWNDKGVAGYPFDLSEQKYDTILAKVIGSLSAGQEEDSWIRKQISHLICGPRSASVTTFVKSAVSSNVRHSFILECMGLIFDYSKLRTAWNDVEHVMRYSFTEKKNSRTKTFLSKNNFIRTKILKDYSLEERAELFAQDLSLIMDNFERGVVHKKWPPWSFDPYNYKFSKNLRLRSADRYVISLENFIQAAEGLPPLEKWDESLKVGWIEFCCSGLMLISARLTNAIKEHGDVKGTPYKQDNWLINAFAVTYFWNDDKRLENALRSFLEVGADGHYWLDNFGRDFFRIGLKHPNQWDEFGAKLNKILQLALSINQLRTHRRSWDADDIWCSLVGLDDSIISFLPVEAKPLITNLFPIYERWMLSRTGSDRCLGRFVMMLCSQAARDILIKGLSVVASELKDVNFEDYYHKHNIDIYSHFLTVIWQEKQTELKNNKIALANFQQILNGLLSVQDTKALELAAKLNLARQ